MYKFKKDKLERFVSIKKMHIQKLLNFILKDIKKKCYFKEDIFIKKDNRIKGAKVEYLSYTDNKSPKDCYLITCNLKRLNEKWECIETIAHELGHIRLKHFTTNFYLTLTEKEYQAEEFALNIIKKYYPKYYHKVLNNLILIDKKYESHYEAFMKLYDERITQSEKK